MDINSARIRRYRPSLEEVDRSFQLVKEWVEVFSLTDLSLNHWNRGNRGRKRESQWKPLPT